MTRNFRPKTVDPVKEAFARGVFGYIARLPQDKHVTGEDIRVGCTLAGIVPQHHNAWGGIILSAQSRGLLTETGKYTAMGDLSSHKRRTSILRVTA